MTTREAEMRWLVFDFGEVISRRIATLPQMAALLDVPAAAFEAAYWAERDAYDRGRTDQEYWRAVGARVGRDVDDASVAALTDADIAGWLDIDPDTLALLDDLAAAANNGAGFDLALLSNAPATHGRAFAQQPWAAYFRHLVISGDLRCAKPDPEIWKALVARLATTPDSCVFFDDKQVNVDGARAAGLLAERWRGAAAARKHLTALGLL